MDCGGKLYRRADNASTPWAVAADTTASPAMIYNGTHAQGEFVALSNTPAPLTISGPQVMCKGSTATLTVNPGNGSVKWSTGATDQNIKITEAGTYSVTVSENGCQRSASITVQEAAPIVIDLGPDKSVCFGETVTLAAPTGMASYKWSNGASTPSIEVTRSGTYSVEVTSAAGCTATDAITITVPQEPKLDWPNELFVCYGKPVTLNASINGATYTWNTGAITPAINVSQAGTYSVNITLNGCSFQRQVVVSAEECPEIPNIITPNGDGKNDTFVMEGADPATMQIEIFNRWGKSIYQSDRYDNGWDAEGVPAGLYFYHLKSSRSQLTYKGWLEVIK